VNVSDGYVRIKDSVSKHPFLIIAAVGLIIRAVLIPLFTYSYDVYHWALVTQHLRSGNGLYGLPGYYYTPVWGYLLAVIGAAAEVLGIAEFGRLFPPLLFVEDIDWEYLRAVMCSPAYTILVKSVLTVFDFITGCLIYAMVKEHTDDSRKASLAFALWFLCPIVIYTTAVHAMFDVFSALTTVLTLFLLLRRRYFLGGAVYSVAVFTKFFPAYLLPIFLVLIIKQEKESKKRNESVLAAILGFVLMFVLIFLPHILTGSFVDTFNFVTTRIDVIGSEPESEGMWSSILSVGYAVVLCVQVLTISIIFYLAYKTLKLKEEGSEFLSKYMFRLMICTAVIFLWTPTPTYLVILIPFLAYVIATGRKEYAISYVIISVSALLYSIAMHNYSLLFQLYGYFGLVGADFLRTGVLWLDAPLLGVTRQFVINVILGAAETIGLYSIYYVTYKKYSRKHPRGEPV
jgi:hypothetical protein